MVHQRLGWVLPGEIGFRVIGENGKRLMAEQCLIAILRTRAGDEHRGGKWSGALRQRQRASQGDTGGDRVLERDFFRTARPSSVIQRFASPAEVAAMIVYVCSTAASATTGAALRVDGGVVRSIV